MSAVAARSFVRLASAFSGRRRPAGVVTSHTARWLLLLLPPMVVMVLTLMAVVAQVCTVT